MSEAGKPMRVLVADDDEAIRLFLRMVLTSWGYEVCEARDGREAWNALDYLANPHMALLDWEMPEIDGVELCRQVRARKKGQAYIYLVVITGKGRPQDVVVALDAGADDYLQKPLDTGELKSRVDVGARIVRYERGLREQKNYLEQRLQEASRTNRRLSRMNQTLLRLTNSYDVNVSSLVRACGELLEGATLVFYGIQEGILRPVAAWNAAVEQLAALDISGSLCERSVLLGKDGEVDFVPALGQSRFARTDPRVATYGLETHAAVPVMHRGRCVGCVAAMYRQSLRIGEDETQILQMLATALGVEEERRVSGAAGGASG